MLQSTESQIVRHNLVPENNTLTGAYRKGSHFWFPQPSFYHFSLLCLVPVIYFYCIK